MQLTLSALSLLALANAAALKRRQEDGNIICFGTCGVDKPDTICLWQCPPVAQCGKVQGDCPVRMPTPVDPPVVDPVEPTSIPDPVPTVVVPIPE